ncbi:MAG: hypothetical protein EBW06_11275, partial [Gammaproteobacteria bacterium]|nr:hypothetical protein [Gammaproteobacteria bacterium]
DTINSLSGSGAVQIADSVTLTTGDSGSDTISGVISGAGNLTKAGAGTLTLSGTNTYTGATNINVGVLSITNNGGTLSTSTGTSSYAGVMTLGDDSTIDVDGTQLTISTAIGDGSNGYGITKEGSGTLILSGASTFSGDLTISAGTVTMTGTLADTVDVANSGTYDVDTSDTINSLSGSGAVQIADSVTLTTGDAGHDTISGVISGAGNLTKAGAGTLTLSAINTYTGDTTINAGTIKLTGALSTSTDLVIGSSGTLDLQATQTFATLDLDGTISNTAGTSALTISGTSDLEGSVTTTSTQTYTGAVTLTGTTTLTTSSAQVTFSNTVNSDTGETNNLTVTASETEFNGVVGGTRTLGVMDINGTLDLNAAI